MEQAEELSFENILRQNHDRIWRLCRVYTASAEDAKDLFQEVAVHIWKGLEGYEGKAAIGTWVYRIALNTAINYSIQAKKKGIHNVPNTSVTDETDNQNMELLYSYIKKLNEADRSIISLYLDDFSNKEIAELLGISENYVAVKLLRIRNKLGEYFKDK